MRQAFAARGRDPPPAHPQDGLRLRRLRREPPVVAAQLGLHHDQGRADVERRGRRGDDAAADRREQVRLRLDRRRRRAVGEVEEGAHRARRVRERHQRAPVQDAARRAQLGTVVELDADGVRRRARDAQPEGRGERDEGVQSGGVERRRRGHRPKRAARRARAP